VSAQVVEPMTSLNKPSVIGSMDATWLTLSRHSSTKVSENSSLSHLAFFTVLIVCLMSPCECDQRVSSACPVLDISFCYVTITSRWFYFRLTLSDGLMTIVRVFQHYSTIVVSTRLKPPHLNWFTFSWLFLVAPISARVQIYWHLYQHLLVF